MAGITDGADLPFDSTNTEPAGNQHAVGVGERRRRATLGLTVVGSHPSHLDLGAVFEATGPQRLGDREVRVREVDVLAHQRDPHSLMRVVHALKQLFIGSSRRRGTAG